MPAGNLTTEDAKAPTRQARCLPRMAPTACGTFRMRLLGASVMSLRHEPTRTSPREETHMSRTHFIMLAETIRENAEAFRSNTAHAKFAGTMADRLRQENPRFNRQTFLTACMPRWQAGTRHANVWERIARQ